MPRWSGTTCSGEHWDWGWRVARELVWRRGTGADLGQLAGVSTQGWITTAHLDQGETLARLWIYLRWYNVLAEDQPNFNVADVYDPWIWGLYWQDPSSFTSPPYVEDAPTDPNWLWTQRLSWNFKYLPAGVTASYGLVDDGPGTYDIRVQRGPVQTSAGADVSLMYHTRALGGVAIGAHAAIWYAALIRLPL